MIGQGIMKMKVMPKHDTVHVLFSCALPPRISVCISRCILPAISTIIISKQKISEANLKAAIIYIAPLIIIN